jgi:hypothetical protein
MKKLSLKHVDARMEEKKLRVVSYKTQQRLRDWRFSCGRYGLYIVNGVSEECVASIFRD